MTKKLFYIMIAVFIIISASFTSFAEEGAEYYDEYDNYYEFEQDYYDTVVFPEEDTGEQWYSEFSPIPPVIGVAVGAAALLVLYRKQSISRRQRQEPLARKYAPNIKHTKSTD